MTNRTFITQHPKASKKAINRTYADCKAAFQSFNIELDHHTMWEFFMHECRAVESESGEPATNIDVEWWQNIIRMELDDANSTGDWRAFEDKLNEAVNYYFMALQPQYAIPARYEEEIKNELKVRLRKGPRPKFGEVYQVSGRDHMEAVLRRLNVPYEPEQRNIEGVPRKFWT